jgi:hypothetical protein
LLAVEAGYNENPYHNAAHAAHVVQVTDCMSDNNSMITQINSSIVSNEIFMERVVLITEWRTQIAAPSGWFMAGLAVPAMQRRNFETAKDTPLLFSGFCHSNLGMVVAMWQVCIKLAQRRTKININNEPHAISSLSLDKAGDT